MHVHELRWAGPRRDDSIPQDRQLSLDELDSYLGQEGLHTLEILHETPFGTDLLNRASIQVDRTVSVTASFYTQE